MKEPNWAFVGYDEAERTAIENVAKDVGKKIDVREVERLALTILSLDENRRPTAKQIAETLGNALSKLLAAKIAVEEAARLYWVRPRKECGKALEILEREIELLRFEFRTLEVAPSAASRNAGGAKRVLIEQIFGLWTAAPARKQPKFRDAAGFIAACLIPIFPGDDIDINSIERALRRVREKADKRGGK